MIVTKDRSSLSELGIRSLRVCKDFLKDKSISSVSITKEMLEYVEKAHAEYSAYLEQINSEKERLNLKRQAEIEEKEAAIKKKATMDLLNEELKEIEKKEDQLHEDEKVSHSLLSEASKKLQDGITRDDIPTIKMAKIMLDTANSNIKNISEEINLSKQKKAEVQKKKMKF